MSLGNRPTYAVAEKTIACKVDDESELYDRFAEYEEDFGNRSQALRAAMRAATDEDGTQQRTSADEWLLSTASNLATAALIIGLLGVFGALPVPTATATAAACVVAAIVAAGAVRVELPALRGGSSSTDAEEVSA
jgi:hypothetical protein